jgi:hypothetical protein
MFLWIDGAIIRVYRRHMVIVRSDHAAGESDVRNRWVVSEGQGTRA